MAETLRMFPQDGVVAFYAEASGGGAMDDIDAPRNRPAKTPASWLPNIRLHSDLDYLEVSHSGTTNINHAAVSAGSLPPGSSIAFGWNTSSTNHLLATHNLGYEVFALVSMGTNILYPGMPVQVQSDGGARYVTVYSTTTELRLHEYASIGSSSLAATSKSYNYLVFKDPPAPTGRELFEFDQTTGFWNIGRGKINTGRRYLSVVPGGSPLSLCTGRTIDLSNGAPRAVLADGTQYNPVPSSLSLALERPNASYVYGGSMAYNGSFTGSATIQVQAP